MIKSRSMAALLLVARIGQLVRPGRQRGRPCSLSLYRSVVLTVVRVRQNLSQTVAGDLVDGSQPTAARTYRRFLLLVGQALCRHVPDLAEAVRGRLVLVDGTDVPTGNRAGHRGNDAGKRRRAGRGVQVASETVSGLLGVSEPVAGAVPDRQAFTACGWEEALAGTPVIADPGYQRTSATTPRKKPPGGELSVGDQADNTTISSIRSAVERCIAHRKNWKILATGYRGRLAELPNVIKIITALEFYRLGWCLVNNALTLRARGACSE